MTNVSDYEQEFIRREIEEDELDKASPDEARETSFSILESAGVSKLAIVVGHSKKRQGAVAVNPINQSEYFWNDHLAEMIQSAASQSGVECSVFYRDGVGISGAYAAVKAWRATTCIELHFNAAESPAKGTETLFGSPRVSESWADVVQQKMISVLERSTSENRGVKRRLEGERGGRNVNQLHNIPSVLVEPFFGHVESEATLGLKQMNDYANALVEAHLSYLSAYS